MERIRTVEAPAGVGQRARVQGWLHAVRSLGHLGFLTIRDGWGTIQAVFESGSEVARLVAGGLALESIVTVEGTLVASEQAGVELHEPVLTVLEPAASPPPVPLHKRTLNVPLPALLDHAVIANRHPTRRAIFALAAGAMAGFRQTLGERGFVEIQTPKLVAGATEGGANVFQVKYFDRTAYLAQSPQFYKQIMVGAFERVFEVGPVFRAEPHATVRHVNEYVSLDAEMGFVENHFTVMAEVREVLAGIFARLGERHARDLASCGATLPEVPSVIPHVHFTEALEIVSRATGTDVRSEPDLAPQHERVLGEWARATHGSEFLFVTGYPMSKRPFYTHPDPARPAWSNSFDLLFRGTELITGGQRLHRIGDYREALARVGIPAEPFAWYLAAFEHGMPPHGGFAIGLERLIAQLTGQSNIRLATLFPRDLARLTP